MHLEPRVAIVQESEPRVGTGPSVPLLVSFYPRKRIAWPHTCTPVHRDVVQAASHSMARCPSVASG